MELILQQDLPHQQRAVEAAASVLDGVEVAPSSVYYENPIINLSDPLIAENISRLQKDIPNEMRGAAAINSCLCFDIKMETGTGKTYVYTKIIYEMFKRYKFNKFIVVVPSLAIKLGAVQFLEDSYVRRHFSDSCGYAAELEINVLEALKNKRKNRTYFPRAVDDFVRATSQNTKNINVLLVNMQLLTSAKLLTRDDYDYGAEGFYRPLDALRAVRPLIIIDEPHRFTRGQRAYNVIVDEIKPQCIIRIGAAFPDAAGKQGGGKDYQNLLYNLNACEAFNQNLIKGIAKEHFEPISKKNEKIKVLSIKRGDSAVFQYKQKGGQTKSYEVKAGDSMAIVNDLFSGIEISAIERSAVEFSNGIRKSVGEEIDPEVYMNSYQEQMISLALERHFESEKENFCNRRFKIKTLALFFIDDITSYRLDKDGKDPYLLRMFERLLREKIKNMISALSEQESEYRQYLLASLEDISASHAGYFSRDNTDTDEDIASEVDIILRKKKELLAFRKGDGSYNTLRFLFSKWTLKEGWDNPNVFTIAKLRSSGSENSKLQEVGRGLRLPVDENGNRVSNEEFMLNYIVDFTEADFAERLVKQVNSEVSAAFAVSEERLQAAAEKLNMTIDALFIELLCKKYINIKCEINLELRDNFLAEYPIFAEGVLAGKIKNCNRERLNKVKIRKGAYKDICRLWEYINRRYLLIYDKDLDDAIGSAVLTLLMGDIFSESALTSRRKIIKGQNGQVAATEADGISKTIVQPLHYGEFLKRISKSTNIPISVIHKSLCEYSARYNKIDAKHINETTAVKFISAFKEWRADNLKGRFKYTKGSIPVGATSLSYADGSAREEIVQGRIGRYIDQGEINPKYLYDSYTYDSKLEKENLTTDIEEVIVYGKIPKNSIAIPTTMGGVYSPDFIYIIKRADGGKELNIIVETKGVEDKTHLRGDEEVKIECAKLFFQTLSDEGYKVYFRAQLNSKKMKAIIDEL
ncbi:MAG: type III restriction-modification system endonuclease [Deferribacteraceae bacterium]|jgi:type III restriction enzyme|nr:type III restriction-modification system endonuclease [Deferribacteraceae bacterium]